MRVAYLLAVLLFGAGCGGNGAIFLTVDGRGPLDTLKVPDEVDALAVKVVADPSGKELLSKNYPLTQGEVFPFTLGLEPGAQTGARVRIEVTGLKNEAQVAQTRALVAMNPREITSVTMVLSVP
jgi:hypothetical protein